MVGLDGDPTQKFSRLLDNNTVEEEKVNCSSNVNCAVGKAPIMPLEDG
uniref:Uncharacterized protein n=1 Tax=Leersia perrieri TaxID=77586 RepID=A0A0D9XCD5_9ORYZ